MNAYPVQQQWTHSLTWKMQTVLLQSMRAPDNHYCPEVKKVSRWLRSKILRNADVKHTFMKSDGVFPGNKALENELGYCSLHYVVHLLYGLELVAFFHPEENVRTQAERLYVDLVSDTIHLNPETKEACEMRLADNDRQIEDIKEKYHPSPSVGGRYWR